MYLSRELTDFSLPKIGEEFGGRDHTTVIHAHEKIEKLLKEDQQLQQDIKQIRSMLRKIMMWITFIFFTQRYTQCINMWIIDSHSDLRRLSTYSQPLLLFLLII